MNYSEYNTKQAFLVMVRETITSHPDWMADTLLTINRAMLNAIDHESTLRHRAEVALCAAYTACDTRKLKQMKIPVMEALANSDSFAKSPYAEKLITEIEAGINSSKENKE